ncbi:MAG: F0F1 ATP synthase subunit B [Nitrospinae bacterium]|nr:F0F1 ATP synthase subunit B [Nitrospinota bacterium]
MFSVKKSSSLLSFLILAAALFSADWVLAADAGAHVKAFSFTEELFKLVNTLIVVAILYKVAFNPIKNFLKDRREGVRKALEESQAAREEAEKQLAVQRSKVADLEAELERVREQGEKERVAMRERLEEEQENQARRLLEQTRTTIELEASKARAELQNQAASLALNLAEEMLKKELGEADQERFVENYLAKLDDRNGGSL